MSGQYVTVIASQSTQAKGSLVDSPRSSRPFPSRSGRRAGPSSFAANRRPPPGSRVACSRSPISVFSMLILVFTMDRTRCSRWTDLGFRSAGWISATRRPSALPSGWSSRPWQGHNQWPGSREPVDRATLKWRETLDQGAVTVVEINGQLIGSDVPYLHEFFHDAIAALR